MQSLLYHHHSQRYFFNWNIIGYAPDKYDKITVLFFSHWSQCWILHPVIFGGFNSRIFSYSNILFFLSPYNGVSGTFHLHYLGHRIKYGNPEVENTTRQFLSTTRLWGSIEFVESFLFWVILVTFNIVIYICIYIYI